MAKLTEKYVKVTITVTTITPKKEYTNTHDIFLTKKQLKYLNLK